MDHFSGKGENQTAFLLSALVTLALMLSHTVTLLLTPELPLPGTAENASDDPSHHATKNLGSSIRHILQNKNVIRVTIIFMLYYIATDISRPFYGTYLITELGFGLKFVSVLTIASSLARIAVSRWWGMYADKTSFIKMLQKCFLVLTLGYLCAACAAPANGAIMFTLYYIFNGIAMGGINSAYTNLVFDHVAPEKRANSLALCQAASGLAGFLATFSISPLVSYVQASDNRFLGLPLYAQQVTSIIAILFMIITLIFIKKMPLSKKTKA